MSDPVAIVMTLLASYVVGSIPMGLVVGRLAGGVDVRKHGSGKIGATNVLRTLGARYAAIVFAGDLLKGALPVALTRALLNDPLADVAAGFGAIVGHNWSLFIRFAGGRGVATSFGASLAIAPWAGLIGFAAFVATVAITRFVSLGSMIGASVGALVFCLAGIAGARQPGEYYVFMVAGAILLIIRHADNIARLRAGNERKLGDKPSRATGSP
ncbi:MAG: glycerol-3-phosphate 1-O-acyltransferase PlsY [Dehalococcoidia bacterium]|nr:glycerol-3-phosphate 1-O-acyltransferase PlsY [Dehalococcoidia bacterium]